MSVITISKEYGIESEEVAAMAADKLGYEYVGKHLLAKIAGELKISESEAEMFSKTSSSSILRYVDKYTCSIVQKVVDGEHGCLDDSKYHDVTRKLVEDLYLADNVIILGWGGQCILKGLSNVLHVRLRKDEEDKIQYVMKQEQLERDAAKKQIQTQEKDLETYISHFFKRDWNDAGLYDLVINMAKIDVEKAADMICSNVKLKQQ